MISDHLFCMARNWGGFVDHSLKKGLDRIITRSLSYQSLVTASKIVKQPSLLLFPALLGAVVPLASMAGTATLTLAMTCVLPSLVLLTSSEALHFSLGRCRRAALAQFADRNKPIFLILKARFDHNKSFEYVANIDAKIAKKFQFQFVEIGSIQEMKTTLRKYAKKKVKVLLLQAHGAQNRVQLGQRECLNVPDLKGLQKIFNRVFASNPTLIVHACNTAAGATENFAQELSRHSPGKIIASKAPCMYLEIDSRGVVEHQDWSHQSLSRVYKSGKEISRDLALIG